MVTGPGGSTHNLQPVRFISNYRISSQFIFGLFVTFYCHRHKGENENDLHIDLFSLLFITTFLFYFFQDFLHGYKRQ